MPVATSKAAKERLPYPHISEYIIRRRVIKNSKWLQKASHKFL